MKSQRYKKQEIRVTSLLLTMELINEDILEDYKSYSIVYFGTKSVKRTVSIGGRVYTSVFKRSFTDDRESISIKVSQGSEGSEGSEVLEIDICSKQESIFHCCYTHLCHDLVLTRNVIDMLTGGLSWTSPCAIRMIGWCHKED